MANPLLIGRQIGYENGRPLYATGCASSISSNVRTLGRLAGYDESRPVYALNYCGIPSSSSSSSSSSSTPTCVDPPLPACFLCDGTTPPYRVIMGGPDIHGICGDMQGEFCLQSHPLLPNSSTVCNWYASLPYRTLPVTPGEFPYPLPGCIAACFAFQIGGDAFPWAFLQMETFPPGFITVVFSIPANLLQGPGGFPGNLTVNVGTYLITIPSEDFNCYNTLVLPRYYQAFCPTDDPIDPPVVGLPTSVTLRPFCCLYACPACGAVSRVLKVTIAGLLPGLVVGQCDGPLEIQNLNSIYYVPLVSNTANLCTWRLVSPKRFDSSLDGAMIFSITILLTSNSLTIGLNGLQFQTEAGTNTNYSFSVPLSRINCAGETFITNADTLSAGNFCDTSNILITIQMQ